MHIRINLNSSYDDKEKGIDMPDIDLSKDYEGRVPSQEEIDALVNILKRCLPEAPTKNKVRGIR